MKNRIYFKSQANFEFIKYMASRIGINTVSELLMFINYYEINNELELINKLWKEVDDVYYPI